MRLLADFGFIILFFLLLIGWLFAWAAYHVAGGAIHILLVLAVLFLMMHFFRRRAV